MALFDKNIFDKNVFDTGEEEIPAIPSRFLGLNKSALSRNRPRLFRR